MTPSEFQMAIAGMLAIAVINFVHVAATFRIMYRALHDLRAEVLQLEMRLDRMDIERACRQQSESDVRP